MWLLKRGIQLGYLIRAFHASRISLTLMPASDGLNNGSDDEADADEPQNQKHKSTPQPLPLGKGIISDLGRKESRRRRGGGDKNDASDPEWW
jgi:hypothetical protein